MFHAPYGGRASEGFANRDEADPARRAQEAFHMRRSTYLPAVLAAGVGALWTPALVRGVTEDFQIIHQAVDVNNAAQTATFTLTFNRAPDFSATPGDGQNEAFQYEIDGDADAFDTSLSFDDIDAIVRGAEIYKGESLPVRERDGDGGPDAGGWGPVRALLPFELDEQTLTFTTGLMTIGDDDGRFRYRLISIEGGALTGEIQAAMIPLPAAVWPGIVMLGTIGAARVFRRA